MKIKHRNCMLPVDMLYPHPGNPRKELGDLTELAESIKKDGIFQNLTVILGGKGAEAARPDIDDPDGYTVIIGHRRLAAAKLAGLTDVPCMVAEMDENEQIATMLLENMQRNDLTVYEQAQGFQMMLDLGETQATIAEKTGLSKTTVRHRLKLLELDEEEFKKSQERQPSISDYIELEKINDPERKNKVLAKIGTSDFKWSLDSAIKEEQRAKYKAEWLAFLSEKLKSVDIKEKNSRRYISSYYILNEFSDRFRERLEIEIEENEGAVYAYDDYTSVYILGEVKKNNKETKEDKEKKKAELKRAEKCRKISELEDQAHELRRDFVAHYDTVANDEEITYAYLTDPNLDDINYFTAAEVLRIRSEDDDYELSELLESEKWTDLASFRPATLFLALLYSIYDYGSNDRTVHRWDGVYNRNEKLENWYRVLKEAGYVMSNDEKRLLNGTHEVFGEGEDK